VGPNGDRGDEERSYRQRPPAEAGLATVWVTAVLGHSVSGHPGPPWLAFTYCEVRRAVWSQTAGPVIGVLTGPEGEL
jgi:hypothetical protein